MQKKTIVPTKKWKLILGIVLSIAFVYCIMLFYSSLLRLDSTPFKKSNYSSRQTEEVIKDRNTKERIKKDLRISVKVPKSMYKEAWDFYKKNPKASKEKIINAIQKGKLPNWYPRGEAPVLHEMVKKGELPPVSERVGPEPVVEKGVDGIGKYGGTWLRAATSEYDVWVTMDTRLSHTMLCRYSPFIEPIVPHVAKSVKMLDGGKVWEVKLRKIRWSDGVPFTADDIMFWWLEVTNKITGMGTPPNYMLVGGKYGFVEKVDKHTVRFVFPEPYGSFKYYLAKNDIFRFRPAHYLKKYHPATGNPEFIKKEMEAYSINSPRLLYAQMKSNLNPDCPVLSPWMIRRSTTKAPYVFVRNPYYFAVDENGNQLPYIDRIQFDIVDSKMMTIAATTGKMSMQGRHIKFDSYTDLMSKAKQAKLKIYHWISGDSSQWMINPNINKRVKPGDSMSEWKAKLLSDKRFRQALSLAINRNKINRAVYYGLGTPSQIEPGQLSIFHNEKLKNAFTKYDPAKANKLLDEIYISHGLDPDKRVNGFRCTPTGKPLTFYLTVSDFNIVSPADFVVNDWSKVGIRCTYSYVSRQLYNRDKTSRLFDFTVWSSNSEVLPLYGARCFIAYNNGSDFAHGWAMWYEKGGLYNNPDAQREGCIPVPKNSPMYHAMLDYDKAKKATSFKEQKLYLDKVFNIAAENLWNINIISGLPQLIVASADMKNIPKKAIYTNELESPGNAGIDTYYFEHPDNTAMQDTISQLKKSTPIERIGEVNKSPNGNIKTSSNNNIISYLIIIILLMFLILLCIRHPFILRRIAIMIPTIIVISILVFTIIQLPPGDFLTLRQEELKSMGYTEQTIERQMNELKSYFHFNEPQWKRYSRWMGFYWFATFNNKDKGLLQGYLGRSMANLKPVNNLLGDRILLTFLISLGTILFTWLISIPIGVYSACRQYSKADYLFTLIGFIGMSIPAFLLALIFSALTGLSGLFSAKYMAQPYWDLYKIIDLLKHIWIPIVIMGIGGTTSMIRVMRANLLDELQKPYVTTAKAKGVKPLKLLFKYPVRIAICPFVSGLGALFPTLVSGTTIIAIVLSLPTVGPLQYTAILNQDMFMAGSLLMILSLLSIIGTLVSDLLLITIDPRIRLSGGKK